MRLICKCPRCRTKNALTIEDADKRKRCTECKRLFKVPGPEQLKNALEILETAKTDIYVDVEGNIYG